jgi:hypothetical protein
MREFLALLIVVALLLVGALMGAHDDQECTTKVCPAPMVARWVSGGRYTRSCQCTLVPK